jgi:hypothetical protein
MLQQNRSYYVYAYLRSKDSERGPRLSPYYIGKGSKYRAYDKQRTIARPTDKSCIVFLEEGMTECEAFALEKYAIALYGRIDKGDGILWNMTDGGEGASGMSARARARIGEANRKRIISAETRSKTAEGNRRRKISTETRAKMSQNNRGENHPQAKTYVFTNPKGDEFVVKGGFKAFCQKHSLCSRGMQKVLKRNCQPPHRSGWRVRYAEPVLPASSV